LWKPRLHKVFPLCFLAAFGFLKVTTLLII